MLFKRNNRSFKFCLLSLDYQEHNEISKIITENGGEICNSRKSPVITFSSSNELVDSGPVFHVNYIRECLRRGELLDLVDFKFGCPEFAGCLMSIFIRGTNMCPSIYDIGLCCSSTAIELRDEAPPCIHKDHDYAQGDCAMEQETNACSNMPLTVLNSSPQDSRLLSPAGSPRDSEFLPDDSPRVSEFSRDSSPQATELPPAGSPQDPGFLTDASPRDSEFLPDDSPHDSEVLSAGTPGDSEFLPDDSPQDSAVLYAGTHGDSDILPDNSPQDPAVLPAGTPRDSIFSPEEPPPASEFPPRDASALSTEFPPSESPQDSEILPYESPPVTEFSPQVSPRDSEFLPDESPPSAASLLANVGSPRVTEYLSDQYSSSIGTIVPETPERVSNTEKNDLQFEIPEPARFEELICYRSTYGPDELPGGDTNLCGRSPTASVDTVIIPGGSGNTYSPTQLPSEDEIPSKKLLRSCSQDTLIITDRNLKRASPSIDETNLRNDSKEETDCGSDVPEISVERGDQLLLEARLHRLNTSKPITPERAISPLFKLKKIVRKPLASETNDDQPVAKGSRTLVSPTILRDKSNGVKILGQSTTDSIRNVENFRIDSSDSDHTVYISSPAVKDGRHRKPANRTLALRMREFNRRKRLKKKGQIPGPSRDSDASEDSEAIGTADNHERTGRQTTSRKGVDKLTSPGSQGSSNEKKVLKTGGEIPGPSRDSDDSGDVEDIEVVNNDVRSQMQTRLEEASDKNGCRSSTRLYAPKVVNDRGNTVASLDTSSDDIISISDRNSDSSSEVASSSSYRAARDETSPKKTSTQMRNQNATVKRRNGQQPLSRNFLPWEQREMVRYLIDKGFISEARGNRVWKQMIQDGFLSHRTYQSLNNHFRKTILPQIHRFSMKRDSLRQFQALHQ